MREVKGSVEDYVASSPSGRIKKWKWWFVVMLLLALAIAIWTLSREARIVFSSLQPESTFGTVSTIAFLQAAGAPEATSTAHAKPKESEQQRKQRGDDPMRPYIMVGILTLIALITLVCLGVSLFSTNTGAVTQASDLLKTCIGFFVGIATSYFGG